MAKLLYPPSSNNLAKQLNANYTNGDATITLNNTTGIQNEPGVCLINRIDSNSERQAVASWTYIEFEGTSGATLTGCSVISGGQDQALGKVVEFVSDVTQQQRILDALENIIDPSDLSLDTTKVVTPTGTQTLTNKTLTSPTVTSPTITGTPVLNADSAVPFYNSSMARQAIMNGNFDVWQRGTSIALTTANGYTSDRWYAETATVGTDKTISRQNGTGVPGSYYCARVAIVQDVDELITFSQALESQDSIKLRGKKATLSFYARGGAEFVADNATLVSKIVTGKGTDQKVLAFTTSADGVSQNNTLTTDWQKFTCTTTAAIASDITQLGVSFAFTHAGSGVTTNYFEIAQVQLCAGEVALPFQPKSFEEELRACQRYYEKSYDYPTTPGTDVSASFRGAKIFFSNAVATADDVTFFKSSKRAIPNPMVIYTLAGVTGNVRNVTDNANTAITAYGWSEGIGVYGSGTANKKYAYCWTAEAEL
jgi:hypothetical protein